MSYQTALGHSPATRALHLHVVSLGGVFVDWDVLQDLASRSGFGGAHIVTVPSPEARAQIAQNKAFDGFLAAYRRAQPRERVYREISAVASYLVYGENNALDVALGYAKSAAPEFRPFTKGHGWPA